ncbi:MAG: hemolysin family protein [Spirochaetaceae bacterium]|jgi:putative hemolysin|nr:hemolysin family protein [Spirochaetaceae bacterium]
MNGDPPLSGLILLALILASAFCTLAETALLESRRSKLLSRLGEKKDKKSLAVLAALKNPGGYEPALQIFRCLGGAASGVLAALWFSGPLGSLLEKILPPGGGRAAPAVVILFCALAYTLLAVMIPRRAARSDPEKYAAALLPPVILLSRILTPLTALLSFLTRVICRVLGLSETGDTHITEDELRQALIEGEKSGIVESGERAMVEGVFYLGDRPVQAFMTHRSELQWLAVNDGPGEAQKLACTPGQRYFPVADGGLDNVTGVVSAEDILITLLEKKWTGLKAIMKSPRFIPETMSALKAFEVFRKGGGDVLFVMDEYGGLAGTLSVSDLTGEIVGEFLESPGDDDELIRQEDGSWLSGGTVSIDELARELSFAELLGEHHEYHTLAGFILDIAEKIPKTGEVYQWNGFRFRIVDMDGNRIDKLLIYPPPSQDGPGTEP